MKLTRKEFLKASAAALSAGAAAPFLVSCVDEKPDRKFDKVSQIICPFCAAQCSLLLYSMNGRFLFVTGDPDDPITKGYLCSRAFSLIDALKAADSREKLLYRAPFSSKWEKISYEDAITGISRKIQATRDASFIFSDKSLDINRIDSIAALAGSDLTNEELLCFSRFCRILGIADVGHDHLVKSGAKNRVLGELLGYGAEPNPVYDIENSGIIIMIGADPAEDSGIYMHYAEKARDHGSEIINIDIMRSKSAVLSDHFVRVKPATDLVFLNGIIHFILKNELFDVEYLKKYTEAGNILHREFSFNSLSGTFSGFNPKLSEYVNKSFWDYELDKRGNPQHDEEFRDPRSVISFLNKITSDYSPSAVKNVCGVETDLFLKIAEIIGGSVSGKKKISFILGSGVLDQEQADSIVHAVVILQLLLGNIGFPGGGIYSIEKYNNYQALNDFIPDWNMLPGNIPLPVATEMRKDISFKAYAHNNRSVSNVEESVNYMSAFENISSSLLRALMGTALGVEHVYKWLPKTDGMFSSPDLISGLESGNYKGAFFVNSKLGSFWNGSKSMNDSLRKLEWAVVTSCFDSEIHNFWIDSPEKCGTEIFVFASDIISMKSGTTTSISRKIRKTGITEKNTSPDAVRIFADIHSSLKNIYSAGNGAFTEPLNMTDILASCETILDIVSGMDGSERINSGSELNALSSVCANHLYVGIIRKRKNKQTDYSSSKSEKFYGSEVILDNGNGYTWPVNCVYLYNKISADAEITRFNTDISDSKHDIIDGLDMVRGKNPFIMTSDGKASLFLKKSENSPFPVYYDFILQRPGIFPYPFKVVPQRAVLMMLKRGRKEVIAIVQNRTDGFLLNNSPLFNQLRGKNLMFLNGVNTEITIQKNSCIQIDDILSDDAGFVLIKNPAEISGFFAENSFYSGLKNKHVILYLAEKING